MEKRDVVLTTAGVVLLGIVCGAIWAPLAFLPAALVVLYLGLFG